MALQMSLRRGFSTLQSPKFALGNAGSEALGRRFKSTDVGDVIGIDLGTTNSCVAVMVSCVRLHSLWLLACLLRPPQMKNLVMYSWLLAYLIFHEREAQIPHFSLFLNLIVIGVLLKITEMYGKCYRSVIMTPFDSLLIHSTTSGRSKCTCD